MRHALNGLCVGHVAHVVGDPPGFGRRERRTRRSLVPEDAGADRDQAALTPRREESVGALKAVSTPAFADEGQMPVELVVPVEPGLRVSGVCHIQDDHRVLLPSLSMSAMAAVVEDGCERPPMP